MKPILQHLTALTQITWHLAMNMQEKSEVTLRLSSREIYHLKNVYLERNKLREDM